jgi:hypothetical protein
MQPTTTPISPNKKVLVAIRFVFFMDGLMQLIQPVITAMMAPRNGFVGAVPRLCKHTIPPHHLLG